MNGVDGNPCPCVIQSRQNTGRDENGDTSVDFPLIFNLDFIPIRETQRLQQLEESSYTSKLHIQQHYTASVYSEYH